MGSQSRSLRCRVLVCNAADTASLATPFLFGKLFGVATTFGFGEKRCRKNLPLAVTSRMTHSDALKKLRRCLRRPDTFVPSEVISQVHRIGIAETLSTLPTNEIESLAYFVQQMIDDEQTSGYTQMWNTPDGRVPGYTVPDGFVVQLHHAIQLLGNAESNGP